MKNNTWLACKIVLISIFISSCKKTEVILPENKEGTGEAVLKSNKVYVADLNELYTEVNDPANAGKQLVLSPGTYTLQSAYLNGGRLELQEDMSLSGTPGNQGNVIIDMSGLPTASFVIPAGRTGGIRMGKGTNSLEWLTIKGGSPAASPFSVINTDLLSTTTNIHIEHCNINCNGSNIGINIRNRASEHSGRKIYAELKNNEVYGGISFNGLAIAAQNANNASSSLIDLTMRNNYVHGNKIGLLAFNSAQTGTIENSNIIIRSFSDRFEGNGCGLDLTGGVNQSTTVVSNKNTCLMEMHGSTIKNNNPSPLPPQLMPVNGAYPSAVFAAAAYNSASNPLAYNRASNNTFTLKCWGCDISNNGPVDIYMYGAWCPPPTILAGSNNLAEVYLHGLSATATVNAVASSPVELAGSNVANVYRN